MTLLSLKVGRLAVEIDPESGGAMARFTSGDADVLRPGPFSNRIAHGRLAFDGGDIIMAPNWPGLRHPMHGDGWAHAWSVMKSGAASATISYIHDGLTGWPFRYRASQRFRLDDDRLEIEIAVQNGENHAVPAGLGLHPFFVREPDCELFFHADEVWLADAEVLPTNRVAVPDGWEFEHGRRPDDVVLDNCFAGWDGAATIRWPGRGLRLVVEASEIFRHLVVYTPPDRPFFCVEPVSHANGQLAATRLEAGATLAGAVSFRVFHS